jgi:hypothetical protein
MIVLCPHCEHYTMIEQLNCGIFRHAVFKDGTDVPPHSSKKDCERFVELDLVLGCCKPFQIVNQTVIKCEYI